MKIYIQNTLTGEKEEFKPLKEGLVSMYNCGPTVYDYAHIGNLRAYVFADTLRRVFEYNGLKVNQVINVTDIGHLSSDNDDGEDKMTKALKREGKPLTLSAMREVADFYFEKFRQDLTALNIEMPEHFPFASDHVQEDIDLVQKLEDKGFTYKTSDGVYFDIKKFPEYGKLGNIKITDDTESRIGINPEKRNSQDFAVWKFNSELGYDAPFGKGFPGWHIECSAMSVKYLGPEFDVHTGGIDHVPVHHNNEIAQSVCAGDPYAKYWMHNAHLNIDPLTGLTFSNNIHVCPFCGFENLIKDKRGYITENLEDSVNLMVICNKCNNKFSGSIKISKSNNKTIYLQTIIDKKIDPLALRYVFLGARYSTPLSFNWETLEGAETALNRIREKISKLPDNGSVVETNFLKFINDDLNTPKALSLISDILNSETISPEDKKSTILHMDTIFGLKLDRVESVVIPNEVVKLMQERDLARANKDFAKSDEIRGQIETLGFEVKDTPEGTVVN